MHVLSQGLNFGAAQLALVQKGAAMRGFRARGRSPPGVWLAAHCQGAGRVRRIAGAGVTMEVRAFTRTGIDLRQSGAVEHKLCITNTAAEYAPLVWLGAVQAACTAVHYPPTTTRLAPGLRTARRSIAGIACRRQRTVRPNTSFKRTRNGMDPGPRGRLVYHRPRGPGSTPLRAA